MISIHADQNSYSKGGNLTLSFHVTVKFSSSLQKRRARARTSGKRRRHWARRFGLSGCFFLRIYENVSIISCLLSSTFSGHFNTQRSESSTQISIQIEMEGSKFLCSANMYVWFADGSFDRTIIMQATCMRE